MHARGIDARRNRDAWIDRDIPYTDLSGRSGYRRDILPDLRAARCVFLDDATAVWQKWIPRGVTSYLHFSYPFIYDHASLEIFILLSSFFPSFSVFHRPLFNIILFHTFSTKETANISLIDSNRIIVHLVAIDFTRKTRLLPLFLIIFIPMRFINQFFARWKEIRTNRASL